MPRDDMLPLPIAMLSSEILPSPPREYDGNANNFDDIFGSAPASPTIQAIRTRGNNEPSDIPRIRSTHSTAGFRDGLTASKGATIQEGFDEGFSLGATMGLRVGKILGVLEGVWGAVSKAEKTGSAKVADADGLEVGGQEKESDNERLLALVRKSRHELRTEGVFGKEYWGSDGIWTFECEEGENGWTDIVDAHPLIRQWEKVVKEEVERHRLDTEVLERVEARRLGESEN